MYTDYRYKIVETSTYASLKEDAVVSNGNEIVIPSSGETSVDIARASWIAQKGIILGSDLNIIRPTSSVHPLFLALSLSNNQVKYNLAKVAQGNSIVHLYNNNLKKVNIYFPNIVEQNKIGNILNSISNCINLHERKCEELTLIKKALLQKLFPKKDEFEPEVRYKNFSDAWEQRKFGNISKTKRGLTYKPTDIGSTGIRVLRSSNIKKDTFIFSNDDVFVKESAINIPFVENGDILITAANGSTNLVGKHAIIRDIPKNSAVHGGFMLITTSKEYEFLNALMSSNWYRKFIKKYVAGGNGAIGNLRKNDLDNQKIYVPKKDEQEQIGEFFKQLDSLIALHQRKLEKLKQLKKFLLQNMFI